MDSCPTMDMDEREAFKAYCDGNREGWVVNRLAAVAYRTLLASLPPPAAKTEPCAYCPHTEAEHDDKMPGGHTKCGKCLCGGYSPAKQPAESAREVSLAEVQRATDQPVEASARETCSECVTMRKIIGDAEFLLRGGDRDYALRVLRGEVLMDAAEKPAKEKP